MHWNTMAWQKVRVRAQILNLEDIVEKEEGSDDVNEKVAKALVAAGAIKELVKDARKTKATNPPDWTGEGGVPKRP